VDLTSDLSATLLVNAGLPIIRLFSLWGSLIPRTTFAGGRIAIQYANRGGMIIRYWAVRIRQNKWAKGLFAAGPTIIYLPWNLNEKRELKKGFAAWFWKLSGSR